MSIEKREILLSVKDVNLSFGKKQILKDINFEIRNIVTSSFAGQGQVAALIGKSGIGKSCIFSILAGLSNNHTGTVLVNQGQTEVKAGDMGVVFQDYYIYTWMTVKAILELATSKNTLIPKADKKDSVKVIAEQFDLTLHLDKYAHQLSGGQKQRVAIAEQILNGGNFILLDEPFSGLDVIMIEKVMGSLRKISTTDELKTLVIVSHDLSNTVSIADTIFLLNRVDGTDPNSPATIIKEIDLIERSLAYQPGIKDMPLFRETLNEIKELIR